MTGPAPRIDPAFAAALDRYDVPPPSPAYADRIVAAAVDAQSTLPASRSPRRDRRGPWTRRALAGGLALVLGTTAVAATLLEHAGIRLPEVVAMLSPAPRVAPSPPSPTHYARAVRHVAAPAAQPAEPITTAEAPPAPEPPQLPPRAALVRERLASLPPVERRVVIRRVVRRAIVARAIERRLAAGGALEPSPPGLAPAERPRLLARPAIRAAIAERIGEARMARIAAREPIAAAAPSAPLSVAPPGAAGPVADAPPAQLAPERLRRLGELRRMRALRQELRRQRQR